MHLHSEMLMCYTPTNKRVGLSFFSFFIFCRTLFRRNLKKFYLFIFWLFVIAAVAVRLAILIYRQKLLNDNASNAFVLYCCCCWWCCLLLLVFKYFVYAR